MRPGFTVKIEKNIIMYKFDQLIGTFKQVLTVIIIHIYMYNYVHTVYIHTYTKFQPQNTKIICESLIKAAESKAESMVPKAQEVAKKFEKLFQLFSSCHNTYNSKCVSDIDISHLGIYNLVSTLK